MVDIFAQELRALFRKAYSPAQMGSEEAETMGRAVLTNQLHPELKSKRVGQEGSFDKLQARARFEEAKQRELAAEREQRSSSRSHGGGSKWWSSTKNSSQGLHMGSQDWGHWRTNLREAHQQEAHRGHIAISHQGKHEPRTVLHVWSNGACA